MERLGQPARYWIIVGALIGSALAWRTDFSLLAGAAVGALTGALFLLSYLNKRVQGLRGKVATLEREQQNLRDLFETFVSRGAIGNEAHEPGPNRVFHPRPAHEHGWHPRSVTNTWRAPERATAEPELPSTAKPLRGPGITPFLKRIVSFFTTGNVVARAGSVVLFFGLGFLLKHAAERMAFPIEIRLLGVALFGIGLIVVGWRLRARQGYGLILQGAGVGTLYLSTFTALRFYDLLPDSLAFALLVLVVLSAAVLALLQDSRALATLGTAGGFLAPVLTSSGDGNHVLLFSYYALLNGGILAIAWHKAWRSLNLLGFAFTFIIGALWGHEAYRPELFATTQPFLLLFFLFYLAITVLFAQRQPPRLKGYVDGTLVFGIPLTAFALQAALVGEFNYGLAYSASVMALIYGGLAALLWRRHAEGMQLLSRIFLMLAGLFATLAIPFAFNSQVTAAAWALEGAALVWLGARQLRKRDVLAGLLLQLGAGITFGLAMNTIDSATVVLNGLFLGDVILALAGFWSSICLERAKPPGRALPAVLLGWGLLWWLGAAFGEAERQLGVDQFHHGVVLILALSALALDRSSRRLHWSVAAYPAIGLLPALCLIVLGFYIWLFDRQALTGLSSEHLLSSWGALAWLVAGAVHLNLLRKRERAWPGLIVPLWHMGGLWLALGLAGQESAWLMPGAARSGWVIAAWVWAPALAIFWLSRANKPRWPVAAHQDAYCGRGLLPVAGFVALWTMLASFAIAPAPPLPYLPLLNPLELTQALVILLLLRWWRALWRHDGPLGSPSWLLPAVVGLSAFVALNGVVARAVHHYAGVPHTGSALFAATEFQTGLSILWSCLALAAMSLAGRWHNRNLWYLGAGLLGLVVIKLFVIELADTGTLGRIVSFLVVGILMLVVGFLSPLPPHPERAREDAPDETGPGVAD